MPGPVPYTPRPYVTERFEPRDRTADYMRQSAREDAEAMRRSGYRAAQLWSGIGQQISGTLQDIAAYPEQQRAHALLIEKQRREDEAYQRQERAYQQAQQMEQTLGQLQRQYQGERIPTPVLLQHFPPSIAATIEEQQHKLFGNPADAEKRGRDIVSDMGGYGPLEESQVEDVMRSPAAGRVRYSFGPGTANGPEVVPNAVQQAKIAADEATAARLAKLETFAGQQGGVVNATGSGVVLPPKAENSPPVGSFEDYVTQRFGPRPTPAQMEQARRTYGDAGRVVVAPSDPAPIEAPDDPQSQDIMSQAGLSYNGFLALTGRMSQLPRDRATRDRASQEVQAWARRRGRDVSTFASQYKAYNDVLEQNIERFNRTVLAEGEIAADISNLISAAKASQLNDVRAMNAAKLWLRGELNDPNAAQYAFFLNQLTNDIALYNAASQGRAALQADLDDAKGVVARGIATGSLTGMQTAITQSVEKMGVVLEASVDRARRNVWDLFGVGDKYTPVARPPKPNPRNPNHR